MIGHGCRGYKNTVLGLGKKGFIAGCLILALVGGPWGLQAGCTLHFPDTVTSVCGDGTLGPGEECDATDLGGQTCQGLGQGFTGGHLACTDKCLLDTSGCTTCGDGVQDDGEECDEGDANSDGPNADCTTKCTLPACGDGLIQVGEKCDSGPFNSDSEPDACRTDCTLPRCGDGVVDSSEICDDRTSDLYDGCEDCLPTDIQVNVVTTGAQTHPDVAMTPDGRFVVVWDSDGQNGGSDTDIYARRYDAKGQPETSEILVNTYVDHDQAAPAVAMDRDGRFVVVWQSDAQDGNDKGIFAQLFDEQGNQVGSEFQVNTVTSSEQFRPDVAMWPDGRFVVVWQSYGEDGSLSGIFGQRYAADGNPVGTKFQVNTFTQGEQFRPRVATAAQGGFVVVWGSDGQDGSGNGVFGQRFTADASPEGSEFQVNTYTNNHQADADLGVGPDGRFVAAWISSGQDPNGGGWGVYAQRYAPDGTPEDEEFRVNTYLPQEQEDPSVAVGPDSDFVIVWDSNGQDGGYWGIYAQRYAADGNAMGDEFQINIVVAGIQQFPKIAMDATGRFVVVWQSQGQDGDDYGIFAALYGADGTQLGPGSW